MDDLPYGGGCAALAEAMGWPRPNCCDSCHEDDELGYAELGYAEYGGKWYSTCCRMGLDARSK